MVCSTCHSINLGGYKFCRECGARLASAPPGSGDPDEARVEQLLEESLQQIDDGNPGQARDTVQAALAIRSDSAAAHSMLGLVAEKQGDTPGAIAAYQRVLELCPDSTADRLRLEALRGGARPAPTLSRWSPTRLSLVAAGAAGIVVFGVGLAILSATTHPPASISHNGSSRGSSSSGPASGSGIRSVSPSPFGPQPPVVAVPALPKPPAPPTASGNGFRAGAATQRFVSTGAGSGATTGLPPGAPGSGNENPALSPSAQVSAPTATANGATSGAAGAPAPKPGLPPAAIGEVIPLPGDPLPAQTNVQAGPIGVGSGGAGTTATPGPGTAAAPSTASPKTSAGPVSHPTEPLDTESGFIKIEPASSSQPPSPVAAPAARAAAAVRASAPGGSTGDGGSSAGSQVPRVAPTIAVKFEAVASGAPSGGSLQAGQKAERAGNASLRKGDASGAREQLQAAIRLFESIARDGGKDAAQARADAEACRKTLAALR